MTTELKIRRLGQSQLYQATLEDQQYDRVVSIAADLGIMIATIAHAGKDATARTLYALDHAAELEKEVAAAEKEMRDELGVPEEIIEVLKLNIADCFVNAINRGSTVGMAVE